jgi:alpha-glucosidase
MTNPIVMVFTALLALCTLALSEAHAAFRFTGNVGSVEQTPAGVRLQLSDGSVAAVELHLDDVVRVRWNPSGQLTGRRTGIVTAAPQPPADLVVHDDGQTVFLRSDRASALVVKAPFQVFVLRSDGSLVHRTVAGGFGTDPDNGLVVTLLHAREEEAYFGMGQRGGPINRRGRGFYLFNVDLAGYEEFTDPLYSSHPFYYALDGSRAHGVFIDNAAVPFLDFDTNGQGYLAIGALKGELDYYVMAGPAPADIARAFMRLTGPSQLPPLWTLGFHQSRYGYASQAEFMWLAQSFRDLRLPCDVLYFDLDFMQDGALFSWNSATFPDPAGMNDALRQLGFRRVNIFDASIRVSDPLFDLFAQTEDLLKEFDGAPVINNIFVGDVGWIDFTRPAARERYIGLAQKFLASGVDGAWVDLNEPASNFMPQAIYDFGGDPRLDLEARNLYAFHHAQTHYEALLRLRPDERPWVMSRGGVSGIHRYAANWSGDASTGFDSMRVNVQMTASMGLSGQNHFGHDIGGFLGSPSAELFTRFMEFAAYTPLFRNHAMNTSDPREPWRFGEPTLSLSRQIIEQRYRLLPYIYSLFGETQRTGEPVVVPTPYRFPQDRATYAQDTDFLLGPWLLVAPVFVEGATTREVYLPAGTQWVDLRSDEVFAGGQTVVAPAPLGSVPVFVRRGAVIPLGPVKQHVEDPVAQELTVEVYAGADADFLLYEDDGRSFGYLDGLFLRTRLSSRATSGSLSLSVTAEDGAWRPPGRAWIVRFHLVDIKPAQVLLDQATIPEAVEADSIDPVQGGWSYDVTTRILTVRAPGQAQPGQVTAILP